MSDTHVPDLDATVTYSLRQLAEFATNMAEAGYAAALAEQQPDDEDPIDRVASYLAAAQEAARQDPICGPAIEAGLRFTATTRDQLDAGR